MRFAMALRLTPKELGGMTALERKCSKHISVVIDIFSWEKELLAARTSYQEGSVLCTAVNFFAVGTGLSIENSKRALWSMTREWELVHAEMVAQMVADGCSPAVKVIHDGSGVSDERQ